MAKRTHILVHYSDSITGDIRAFEKYHKEVHGWSKVGYNYVIPRDGSIENIIGEDADGIHAGIGNWNSYSIGICVVASKEQPPNRYQYRTLMYILNMLIGRYGIAIKNVLGHKETGRETDCPGPIDMDKIRKGLEVSRFAYKRFCNDLDSSIAN